MAFDVVHLRQIPGVPGLVRRLHEIEDVRRRGFVLVRGGAIAVLAQSRATVSRGWRGGQWSLRRPRTAEQAFILIKTHHHERLFPFRVGDDQPVTRAFCKLQEAAEVLHIGGILPPASSLSTSQNMANLGPRVDKNPNVWYSIALCMVNRQLWELLRYGWIRTGKDRFDRK